MPSNKDVIRMHLEEFIKDYPEQTWYTILGYCVGYYEKIDMDVLWVVRCLQAAGKIE